MNTKNTNQLAKRVYALLFAVFTLAIFPIVADQFQVGAQKDSAQLDAKFEISQVPDCGYGYNECTQSCQPASEFIQFAQNNRKTCLDSCRFLYQDCKSS